MKKLERTEQKRLAMYLNIDIHCRIKIIAAEKNMSITEWVNQAIIERLNKDIDLGF